MIEPQPSPDVRARVADALLLRPHGRRIEGRLFAMEQLGLAYLAAACRKEGFSARIIDGCLQPDEYDREIAGLKNGDYSVIGYPLYSENLKRVSTDVLELRGRGVSTHITVGNHLPTLCASAIRGEGEGTFVDLLRRLRADCILSGVEGITYRDESEIKANSARPNVSDLDTLPFPARDTLELVLAAGNVPLIYSSRGCNARCDFCSVHKFFNASPAGAWRGRSRDGDIAEGFRSSGVRFRG